MMLSRCLDLTQKRFSTQQSARSLHAMHCGASGNDGPVGYGSGYKGVGTSHRPLAKRNARKDRATRESPTVAREMNGRDLRFGAFGGDCSAYHVAAERIIASGINNTTAGNGRIVIKPHATSGTDLTETVNVDPLSEYQLSAGRHDQAKVIYSCSITNFDVVQSNDLTRLCDLNIIANPLEADAAKVIGPEIARIEWVFHAVNLRRTDSGRKLNIGCDVGRFPDTETDHE